MKEKMFPVSNTDHISELSCAADFSVNHISELPSITEFNVVITTNCQILSYLFSLTICSCMLEVQCFLNSKVSAFSLYCSLVGFINQWSDEC